MIVSAVAEAAKALVSMAAVNPDTNAAADMAGRFIFISTAAVLS